MLLYHLQRHSDHHANPTRRYQTLRDFEESPVLPTGYAGMIVLALLPPLWRRVMDPRVLDHFDGDITRANIHPRASARRCWPATGPRPAAGVVAGPADDVAGVTAHDAQVVAGAVVGGELPGLRATPTTRPWARSARASPPGTAVVLRSPTTGAAPTAGSARRSTSLC